MRTTFSKTVLACLAVASIITTSCSKKGNNNSDDGQSRIQLRLTDKPIADVKEVWVDIKQIELKIDSAAPVLLSGVHAGVYNLLNFTNGKDTLLADATIPPGTISQIRLILGDNNYIITTAGKKIELTTPSAQQSGLKVQVHQRVDGGVLYRLTLDFDASMSIVKAGNSGNYILKPVLRILSFIPSGGNLKGVVLPDSVRTAVYALKGPDTIATTFTAVPGGGYVLRDVPAGFYSLYFVPSDTTFKSTQKTATVVLGQTTIVDTVRLQK